MNKILSALAAALAFVLGTKESTAALKQQIADRDKTIVDLQAALEAENADDASREQALADSKAAQAKAEADLAALLESITEGEAKADALAAEISADDEIPLEVVKGKVHKTK